MFLPAMFSPDIISLRQFYATPMGESVRALIAGAITRLWPSARNEAMLALGYATPYLAPYLGATATLAACMPAQQGAAYFPQEGDNIALLAHDSELPFSENSFNRVLLVHSAENSEQLSWMIQEIWRTLTPGGRMLAVVPNRFNLWSRSSRSPFGYGRPFSIAQFRDLLTAHHFDITRTRTALFMPPTRIGFVWKAAQKLETFGYTICDFLGWHIGGVLLVEAEKKIYSSIKEPVVEGRRYRPAFASAKPVMTKS